MPTRSAQEAELLVASWSDFLSTIPWHHLGTLTFADPVAAADTTRLVNRYVRNLERLGGPVWFASATESGSQTSRVHVHLILGGTDLLPSSTLASAWRYGIAQIDVFDPARGGVRYLCKSLGAGGEIEFADHLRRKVARWRKARFRHSEG